MKGWPRSWGSSGTGSVGTRGGNLPRRTTRAARRKFYVLCGLSRRVRVSSSEAGASCQTAIVGGLAAASLARMAYSVHNSTFRVKERNGHLRDFKSEAEL